MKRNKLAFLVLFIFIKLTVSVAQIDTTFWFAAPWVTPDHWWKENYVMHISTFNTPNTVVRLRQPSAIAPNKYDTTINIPANSNFDYVFWRDKLATATNFGFDSLETRPANTVVPYGIYISSTASITIVYDVITRAPNFFNPETFSLKGQNGLGLEFVCPFQTRWNNQTLGGNLNGDALGVTQPKQQINIVASQPNTVVWITPKTNVVGHPANVTYSVLLTNYGSAYTVENVNQNTTVNGNNLSGTIVVADKPISVTVADDSVSGVTGCYDLMGDQIVPVEIVGTDYILNKGYMNGPEHEGAYVVGTENFTQLTINDGTPTTTVLINKGDTYHYKTTQSLTYINATKPVYCLHASGTGCELGEALLPPLNCAGSSLVSFSRTNPQGFYLNLLCKNGSQSTFTLNNATSSVTVPITAANFTLVPGTAALPGGPFYGGQLNLTNIATLPIGSYTVANSVDVFALGVFGGNASTGGLFHYMSSFLRKTIVKTQTVSPYCVGSGLPINLTGTVSGGAITGVWTTANGTGSFGAYTSTLNTISTSYNLSLTAPSDTALTSIKFYLTSTGNCIPKKDSITVPIIQRPKVSIGTGSVLCKNNITPIILTGTISNALGGAWSASTGTNSGFIQIGSNITYTPSSTDIAAGAITLSLSSVGGCTTTVRTLTVSFINPPTITGLDGDVCTNSQSITLTSAVVGSTLNPTWTTPNGTGFFNPTNSGASVVYSLSPGDYSLTVINFSVNLPATGPCAAVNDNVQLTMRPKPLATILTPTTPICASAQIINLNGTIGGSASLGNWSTPNGAGIFSSLVPPVTTYTMGFSDITNGLVTFHLITDPGLYNCPRDTAKLTLSILNAANVIINVPTAVCENAPVALSGTVLSSNNLGVWSSSGTGVFSPTNTALGGQYLPSVGDVSAGSVNLFLSALNPLCAGPPSSVTVNFVDAPDALFTPSSVRCKDSIMTFINGSQANGTSNLTAQWNFGTAATSSVVQSTTPGNALYTYTNIGSYVITLTVTGTNTSVIPNIQCPDTVSKRITVNPLPIPNFNYLNACQGLPAQFRDSSIVIPGNIVGWNWQFGDGSTNSPVRNPVHTYTTAGVYNVVLTAVSNNSCAATVNKLVTINPQPIANFGMTNDPTIALEPVYFSDFSAPTGSITSWLWSFGDEGSGTGSSPTHIYQNSGLYVITLTVFDNNGCSDTISKKIDVQILPQVPTAFTPNKDNNNDLLFVKGGPFERITFRVYNNWGELLFETNDQKIGWDGTKNGKDQPVGVYVWTLVVDMYNNRQVKKNGDITLIR